MKLGTKKFLFSVVLIVIRRNLQFKKCFVFKRIPESLAVHVSGLKLSMP